VRASISESRGAGGEVGATVLVAAAAVSHWTMDASSSPHSQSGAAVGARVDWTDIAPMRRATKGAVSLDSPSPRRNPQSGLIR